MSKLIKNWKLYTESLILEKSDLSKYFTKDEIRKLHRKYNIPHNSEIKKVKVSEINTNNTYNTRYLHKNNQGEYVINSGYYLSNIIENGTLSPIPEDIYLISNYEELHNKRHTRSLNKGDGLIEGYYNKYIKEVFGTIIDKFNIDVLSDNNVKYDVLEDLQRNMGLDLYGFEYVDELIDHIVNDQDYLYNVIDDIFDYYSEGIKNDDISYDEFKHNFSVYLIENYSRK